jgi:hypothetical protein
MKDILILQACGHADEKCEIENIKSQAELYDMKVVVACINNYENLNDALAKNGTFDYIYLSSHGNDDGFCNESEELNCSWRDFGTLICDTQCLKDDSVLLISCCRGGLNNVAYDMFFQCGKIEYVVGPRQNLTSSDILIGFNLLLYNLEHRGIDPIVACQKVLSGTDIRFKCFDRLETESDPAYINRVNQLIDFYGKPIEITEE